MAATCARHSGSSWDCGLASSAAAKRANPGPAEGEVRADLEHGGRPRQRGHVRGDAAAGERIAERAPVRKDVRGGEADRALEPDRDGEGGRPWMPSEDENKR